MSKSILSKIKPMHEAEDYFMSIFREVKELDKRSVTFHLMNKTTTYPEAYTIAEFSLDWLENLNLAFNKFEKKSSLIKYSTREKFESYCEKNSWSVQEYEGDLFARTENRFEAKFNMESGAIYMRKPDSILNFASNLFSVLANKSPSYSCTLQEFFSQ